MTRERRESDYPAELETQFIMRLPEEPARELREALRGEFGNLKDRLAIQIDNDMRYGQVRLDHRLMHARIVDLPTLVESLKTIDNKSFYKTADISQMMICKEEPDQPVEEESPAKNKKKDPYKVDKKFLFPHGITPPSKNVRKRRFRKTLKKKCAEAPEIEKEVKRLLRVDNEAETINWEVIEEEDDHTPKAETSQAVNVKTEKNKVKQEGLRVPKMQPAADSFNPESSDVVDIFGGAVSDSDLENDDDNMHDDREDTSRLSAYDSRLSDSNSMQGSHLSESMMKKGLPTQFKSEMFYSPQGKYGGVSESQTQMSASRSRSATPAGQSAFSKSGVSGMSSEDDGDYQPRAITKENISIRMEQLSAEIEDLKQQRLKTQHEISGIENLALRQRFETNLQNLQQEISYKEIEYQEFQNFQQQTDD